MTFATRVIIAILLFFDQFLVINTYLHSLRVTEIQIWILRQTDTYLPMA